MYLNLARKWRSKKFEEVIGQDFAIKVLKNCLYKNLISPVYLISGPKGCGKTTVARLFASALNCENLSKFREDPKHVSLPCSSCYSCTLFNKSAHPDFIEIDAASNTGVENVRQIIDSASFVPALGSKRIYLIDEAHMLSKAAFNALLKTLEEPPASVLFILATTEVNKVIDTVRSRCFQMFFMPVDKESLLNHLAYICKAEQVAFDQSGLELLVQESHGSVRDALNLLEKVKAGFNVITKDAVLSALGLVPEEYLMNLAVLILKQRPQDIITFYVQHDLEKFDQFALFKKLVHILYFCLTFKMKVPSITSYGVSLATLEGPIASCSVDRFISMLDICYSFELMLVKTAYPSVLMQNLLIKLCLANIEIEQTALHATEHVQPISIAPKKSSSFEPAQTSLSPLQELTRPTMTSSSAWHIFLQELEQAQDPLILSIFKQGNVKLVDHKIYLSFNKELAFFKDCLENAKSTWFPLLSNAFKADQEITIEFIFTQESSVLSNHNTKVAANHIEKVDNQQTQTKKVLATTKVDYQSLPKVFKQPMNGAVQTKVIPIDLDKYQKVNIISKIFPGKVTSSLAIDSTFERKHE